MTNALQIYLFGPFQVFHNNRLITNQQWRSQQTRTICKYLLTFRGQVVSSDQIIEAFWPDEAPEVTRRRLHVRISQLRTVLESGKFLLQTVDGGYIFSPDESCWLDVDEFQSLLTEASRYQEGGQQLSAIHAYERALELYRGDFLSEEMYADWAFPAREFLRERFLTTLIELSECYAQQGRFRLAIARCQEALLCDPVRESIYVRLMLYHYYAGERAQALRISERCHKILAEELDVEPLPSTLKLASQIRAGRLRANADAPHYPAPIYEGRLFEVPCSFSELPLVGRDREYSWLIGQWQADEKRVILLEGEAGIGKSRLATAFLGYIASQERQVLQARVASARHSPFLPIAMALRPLLDRNLQLAPSILAALAGLFPEIGERRGVHLPLLPRLAPKAERQRLFEAVEELVKAGSNSDMLLFVDDAHRLGMADCELLARLSGTLKVFLSFRSDETLPNHPIRKVFKIARRASEVVSWQLEPLNLDGIRILIRQLAKNDLPEIASQIGGLTGGNPLYTVALLQHLFESGQLYVDADGGWSVAGEQTLSLPPTVRETIELRLRCMNRSQRRIFDLAAVLGGEFDFALLQEASQQPEDELLATLDELIDLNLIFEPRSRERSDFSITHDCYTDVAYDTIPAARGKRLHHTIAKAIESVYAEELDNYFPALTYHFGKARVIDSEFHYAFLAGEQAAAQFANQEAIRYLSRALELAPVDHIAQRYQLLLARERVYDLQGDRQHQKIDLEELSSLSEAMAPYQLAEISLRKAAYAWIIGDDSMAAPFLEKAVTLAKDCQATEIEIAAYLLRGRSNFDQEEARRDLQKARILAQQEGLRGLEGDIVRCLGNACFWQNSFIESRTYFDQALDIHREVGDRRGELSVLNNLGYLLQLLGELDNALAYYEHALVICRKIGDRLAEGVLLTNLGNITVQLGNYQHAWKWLELARGIREEIENEEGVSKALKSLGDVSRLQGRYMHAIAKYENALEISIQNNYHEQQGEILEGLAMVYRVLGDYRWAQDYFERAIRVLNDEESPNRIRILANWSLLHHNLADNKTALEIGTLALSQSEKLPQISAIALTNLGHALAGLRQFEQARDQYMQALDIRRSLRQPHMATEALAGLAEIAMEQNDLIAALRWVEEILEMMDSRLLEGPDQLFRVYLTCYQVLSRLKDPRGKALLQTAFKRLQKRATAINDACLRESYLGKVQVHRAIMRLSIKSQ